MAPMLPARQKTRKKSTTPAAASAPSERPVDARRRLAEAARAAAERELAAGSAPAAGSSAASTSSCDGSKAASNSSTPKRNRRGSAAADAASAATHTAAANAAAAAVEAARFAHLSAAEVAEFREMFAIADRDGSGAISVEELGSLMSMLGLQASAEELDTMASEIDTDGSGQVDFHEFVAVMSRKADDETRAGAAKARVAFEAFERGCPPGFVRYDTLKNALTTFGNERLTIADATELLSQMDVNERGLINYAAFVEHVAGASGHRPSASA